MSEEKCSDLCRSQLLFCIQKENVARPPDRCGCFLVPTEFSIVDNSTSASARRDKMSPGGIKILWLGWCTSVAGQIRLHSPESLVNEVFNRQAKPGYIQGSTATFGAPYYGLRVMGRIIYAPSHGNDYCTEDDYHLPDTVTASPYSASDIGEAVDHTSENSGENHVAEGHADTERRQINIVLIKRGESKCRFTRKVQVAEKHKNAHAVIVVDRKRNSHRDVTKLIMSDENGFGNSIKIPSILINWNDGEKLIHELEANGNDVIADLQWDIPVNNIVTMDVWMSASSREATDFLIGFKDAAEQLAYNLKVVPHYHIFSLPSGQDFENMCTSREGTYCAEDPDGGGPVSGIVGLSFFFLCCFSGFTMN